MTVGDVIRSRREELGVEQRQLAEWTGVSAQFLSDVERGRRRPKAAMGARLAQELGLDGEWFLALCGHLPERLAAAAAEGLDGFRRVVLPPASEQPALDRVEQQDAAEPGAQDNSSD